MLGGGVSRIGRTVVGEIARVQAAEKLLDRDRFAFATQQPLIVHGHQRQEDRAVWLRIVGGGQQQAENGRPAEHQRLAPPPFAETGERLAVIGLALFVAFFREFGDGKLGFDE